MLGYIYLNCAPLTLFSSIEDLFIILPCLSCSLPFQISSDFSILNETRRKKLLHILSIETGKEFEKMEQELNDCMNTEESEITGGEGATTYESYEKLLKKHNTLDFDSLLHKLRSLLEIKAIQDEYQERYRDIFVDEFQDTNSVQLGILKLLVRKEEGLGRSFFAVGDPNQLIYSWRGAVLSHINDFESHFGPESKRIVLSESFRCNREILATVSKLMSKTLKEPLVTNREGGEKVSLRVLGTAKNEAQYIASSIKSLLRNDQELRAEDCSVLVRTASLLPPIRVALEEKGLSHKTLGQSRPNDSSGRLEECLCYLTLASGATDDETCKTALSGRKGIGKLSIENLSCLAQTRNKSLFELCVELVDNPSTPQADLRKSTLSAVKEFVSIIKTLMLESNSQVGLSSTYLERDFVLTPHRIYMTGLSSPHKTISMLGCGGCTV